ncbi:MAG: hypothetical protein J7497_01765 [Chitinophagaceae bacterium]|nr:hypothetical protein [Chitinophagaceae bacterium]
MPHIQPFTVTGFHSCDREVGIRVLNGKDHLQPSSNSWDWLGPGTYFWEQNPLRALEYAEESSKRKQFNKIPIKIPFVLGAIIDLGNCLNLVEAKSIEIIREAYNGLRELKTTLNEKMPVNKGNNRALDCSVMQYINQVNRLQNKQSYDTIRCAFSEGVEAYPGSNISSRLHIQICVLNPKCIQGYFLPQPIIEFNPYLRAG